MRIMTAQERGAPGTAVALGNFDGVHLGHRAVIAAAQAAAPGAPLAVATFDPHPRRFFRPDAPAFLLTPPEERARKLAALGVDRLHVLSFDAAMAAMTPEAFAREILSDRLGAASVAVGADFRFGAGRAGDVARLEALGAELGFSVRAVAPQADATGRVYSSSAARAALREGRPEEAAAILGEPHRIAGAVETGDRRGRSIGFPTANLALDGVLAPAFGVYAARVEIMDGPHAGTVPGVVNIGMRPTFAKAVPILEAHLFDFSGDLYGARIGVALIRFLRPERKFDGIEALRAQIAADSQAARSLLSA